MSTIHCVGDCDCHKKSNLTALQQPPTSVTTIHNKLHDVRFDYRVVIDRYTDRKEKEDNELESMTLTLPDGRAVPQFRLHVDPKTKEDLVYVGIWRCAGSRLVRLHYQVSLIDKKGDKTFSRSK